MQNKELLKIGKIIRFHGLNGFIVFEKFSWIGKFVLPIGIKIFIKKYNIFVEIEKYFFKKNRQIIKFKEFNSLNEVKELKDLSLEITSKQFEEISKLPYLPNLIGYDCKFENKNIGKIIDFFSTVSNPIIEIKSENKKILVPFIKLYIKDVNKETKTLFLTKKVKELMF